MPELLLCDDTPEHLRLLENILAARFGAEHVHSFAHPAAALEFAESGGVFDIAVLDILLPDMDGTALAARLRANGFTGPVVFLTSSNDFASEAFGVRAFDYLLKPVDAARVNAVFDRLERARRRDDNAGFTVTVDRALQRVQFRDLLFAEAQGRQIRLRLSGGSELWPYMTMKDCAALLLEDRRFAFCHHSFVVNLDYVKTVTSSEALLREGLRVPVSRRYGDGFRTSYLKRTMRG